MARKFITPNKDTSIYEEYPQRNTGNDEIIEIGKNIDGTKSIRGLLQFDVTQFSAIPYATASFYLNLRMANGEKLQKDQIIYFYQASQSWDEGSGYFVQDNKNTEDGASWEFRIDSGSTSLSESYSGGVTQSTTASADVWGSAYDSILGGTSGSLIVTRSYGWLPEDVRVDITDTVRSWIDSGSNNGMLIKVSEADEINDNVEANIKFFSRQTHTIFPPTIEAIWNSQTMSIDFSGSLTAVPDEFELFLPNMRRTFITGSTQRIRIGLRASHPVKSFTDTFQYSNKYYLPTASYYAVIDEATNAYVVPFDTGSLISTDVSGSYFDLKIENMFVNRIYSLQVKVEKDWGEEIIDTHNNFKVVLWAK